MPTSCWHEADWTSTDLLPMEYRPYTNFLLTSRWLWINLKPIIQADSSFVVIWLVVIELTGRSASCVALPQVSATTQRSLWRTKVTEVTSRPAFCGGSAMVVEMISRWMSKVVVAGWSWRRNPRVLIVVLAGSNERMSAFGHLFSFWQEERI